MRATATCIAVPRHSHQCVTVVPCHRAESGRRCWLKAFERAGFSEVRWHHPVLSPEALKDYDQQYWSTFLDFPPVAFIECIR